MEAYKRRIQVAFNKGVRKREFQVGDWVLRRTDALAQIGKMEANWEGPYKIITVLDGGSYYLEDVKGKPLPRPWNIHHLRNTMPNLGNPTSTGSTAREWEIKEWENEFIMYQRIMFPASL